MSIIVYIATAINTFLFLLTKHPLYLRSSGTGIEMGAFFPLFTLVTGGFRGRPMWGTFWVWDARLTSVFISFLIYLGALRFQKLPVEPASISIRAGPIDIPIIKSSVNWWNTSHQPGSISRSGGIIPNYSPFKILSPTSEEDCMLEARSISPEVFLTRLKGEGESFHLKVKGREEDKRPKVPRRKISERVFSLDDSVENRDHRSGAS
ncbi:unnamed protein product [Brassica oleracea]